MGEEVCAWIKFEEGQQISFEDLISHCKGKIAHYKIPRYFRTVKEFPMTITGKIKKNDMRHITNELLKQKEHDIFDTKNQ